MFGAMLARHGIDAAPEVIPVCDGALVPAPEPGDALLITGSPAGVYEPHEFIAPLCDRIRDFAAARAPMVGICFGHQIMAHALGGQVEKSVRGWGVGVHVYDVLDGAGLGLPDGALRCLVSHQDQVVERPAAAIRLAGSPFCPNGVLFYPEARALSFQMHPEFEPGYARALLAARADRLPAETYALAEAGLDRPTDRAAIAAALCRFIKENIA
jgi:GMP synthase-like glutamine amidotransferase